MQSDMIIVSSSCNSTAAGAAPEGSKATSISLGEGVKRGIHSSTASVRAATRRRNGGKPRGAKRSIRRMDRLSHRARGAELHEPSHDSATQHRTPVRGTRRGGGRGADSESCRDTGTGTDADTKTQIPDILESQKRQAQVACVCYAPSPPSYMATRKHRVPM